MKIYDDVIAEIDRGKEGLNEGLPMGFQRLVEYLPNIQKKTYYLYGAGPGEGKTTLVDQSFIYSPYDYLRSNPNKKIELDIDCFSFEIDKVRKIIKGVSRKLFLDYGIKADVNYIMSKGKNRISAEIYIKIIELREYFEKLEDILHIYDIPQNPTGLNKYLYNKALSNGHLLKKDIVTQDEWGNKKTIQIIDKYVPNNPDKYWIIIIDHISLLKEERGFNTKQLIDKMSEYLVFVRNKFSAIPVIIQQLNYDINSPERARIGRLSPMLSDFGDSRYTIRDADYVCSLFNPHKFELKNYASYNTGVLKDRFRSFEILKGRDGGIGTRVGLHFQGEVGLFTELPKANEMNDEQYKQLT